MKQKILTGIKPTGIAHLGNYFGAIQPAVEMAKEENNDCYFFIADYHALTTVLDAKMLKEYTYNIACTWLACGLNPENVVFYKQSAVEESCELNWILSNLTAKGLMNRAHAYKAKVDHNIENEKDKDFGINMGLYNYPILMTADILLFNADIVPVGSDQTQHVEIARDIANVFNKTFGEFFVLPKSYTHKTNKIVAGLDGRKMSKSYNNTIELFMPEDKLKKTINKIVTDSSLPNEPKGEDNTICSLYKLFATQSEYADFVKLLENGIGWGDAKKRLFEVANKFLAPMREKYEHFQNHREEVDEILRKGAEKAKQISANNLKTIRKMIGID